MQVCLMKAQVKSGVGVCSEWWRTDGYVTGSVSFMSKAEYLVCDTCRVIQVLFSDINYPVRPQT